MAVCSFSCKNNAKPILMVMADYGFYDPEYTIPRDALEKLGYKTEAANVSGGVSVGLEGLEVKVDLAIKDAREENYHSIVLVGGTGAIQLFKNPELIKLAQDFHKAGKLIGAQCYTPIVLAQAGLLQGEKATCWDSVGKVLESYGVIYTGEVVELSKYILTARAGDSVSITKFSDAYIGLLKNKEYVIKKNTH